MSYDNYKKGVLNMKTDINNIELNNTNIINDTCNIIDSAQNYAFQQINTTLVKRNWRNGICKRNDCGTM